MDDEQRKAYIASYVIPEEVSKAIAKGEETRRKREQELLKLYLAKYDPQSDLDPQGESSSNSSPVQSPDTSPQSSKTQQKQQNGGVPADQVTVETPEELLKNRVMAGGDKHGCGTEDSAEIKDLGVLVDSLEPPKDIQASMEAVRALKRELQAFRGGFTGGPLSLRTVMEKQDKLRALEEQVTKRLLQQTKVLRGILAYNAGGTYED